MSVAQILHMFPYVGDKHLMMPMVNHHFVSHDSHLDSLRQALKNQIHNDVFSLNDKIWVVPYKVTDDNTGFPLYTVTGDLFQDVTPKRRRKPYPTATFLYEIDKDKILQTRVNEIYNEETGYSKASCFFAIVDGCHRLYLFHEFIVTNLGDDESIDIHKLKKLKFTVNVLLNKKKVQNETLLRCQQVSMYFADVTRKGKGHTLWDTLASCLDMLNQHLCENANNKGLMARFLARQMSCPMHKTKEETYVPGYLYSKNRAEVFAAMSPILVLILQELLKFDLLLMDWKVYHKVKKDEDVDKFLHVFQDATYSTTVLDKVKIFLGSSMCKTYLASPTVATRTKIVGVNLPFSFIQLLHLLITAAMSKEHLIQIRGSLKHMAEKNLLSLNRLLIIISYMDDLANAEGLLASNKFPRNSFKVKKVFHGMVLLSVLQTFCQPEPNKTNITPILKKQIAFCGFLRSHKVEFFECLEHEQLKSPPYNFLLWDCVTDILLTLYVSYITDLVSQPWFADARNNFLDPFTRLLQKHTTITSKDFFLPDYIQLTNTNAETMHLPLSMRCIFEVLFHERLGLPLLSPHWNLSSFHDINVHFFKIKLKLPQEKKRKSPKSKERPNYNYIEEAKTFKGFQKTLLTEYADPSTKHTRKVLLATTYASVCASMILEENDYSQLLSNTLTLDTTEEKHIYMHELHVDEMQSKHQNNQKSQSDSDYSDSDNSDSDDPGPNRTTPRTRFKQPGLRTMTLADLDYTDTDDSNKD